VDPEHISKPLKQVMEALEVVYSGNDFDLAIERKLSELGIRADQVWVIIAIPEGMAGGEGRQRKLFNECKAEGTAN